MDDSKLILFLSRSDLNIFQCNLPQVSSMFFRNQKRHNRRGKIRKQRKELNQAINELNYAISNDNISDAVVIVSQYPQFKTQLLLCDVQSISMAQALVDIGVPCNYWTLEGANTKACIDFIRNYTSIRN